MLASLSNPLLLLLLTLSQQPGPSAQAHALPSLANQQQPLQNTPELQPQETSIPSLSSLSHTDDPEKITMHTTLTLYTATQTITVPNTREAMRTSLSSFAEDAEDLEERENGDEEVDECDPAQCAGCRAWYLCSADEGVEW
jgi:hypothetical protein